MDIYVKLPADWASHKICFWDTTLGTWPDYADLEVVDAANHIYKYNLPDIVRSIILSGGENLDTKIIELNKEKNYIIVTDVNTVEYSTYPAQYLS